MDPRTRRSRRTLAALAAVAALLSGCHRSGAAADTASSVPELGLAAAYGSPMAEEVQALGEFRDRHLRTNAAGRAFARASEAVSPPLAELIRPSTVLRAAVRAALWPVVAAVKHPREAVATVIGVIAGTALWRSRRRGPGRGAP